MSFEKVTRVALAALLAVSLVPVSVFAQPAAAGKPAAAPAKPGPVAPVPVAPAPAAPPSAAAPPAAPAAGATAPSSTESGEAAAPNPANKAESEQHFNRGIDLLNEQAWQAALAEFLRSRELFPTRNATNNAGICLRKLSRFDEALDMFENMLREYPTMAPEKKADAQKQIAELRQLVGTVDVTGSEPGASIVVDGRTRADFPLLDPLRVSAGTHSVRVFKQGFRPFEDNIDVAGGQTVRVVAKLSALEASGTLKVSERTGKALTVVVDGATVGVTPWEGPLAVGEHVVLLRGDGDIGSVPTPAPVKRDGLTAITLAAETLESSFEAEVTPAANIIIDGVVVGRGVWDGRLKAGAHQLGFQEKGYFGQKKDLNLERGQRSTMKIKLERDENADAWRKPSKIVIDVSGGFAVAPNVGGDVVTGCSSPCTKGPGLGGMAMLHLSYEFGNGFGLGLAGGFLQNQESITGRKSTLQPIGLKSGLAGTTNDELRIRGGMVGLAAGVHFFEKFPLQLRLGGGALIANVRSIRDGTFTTRAGDSYVAPELESSVTSAFVYIDPEVILGVRFADHFEIGAGLQALVLISVSKPTWGDGSKAEVVVPGDGLAKYSSTDTLVGTSVIFVPSLKARVDF